MQDSIIKISKKNERQLCIKVSVQRWRLDQGIVTDTIMLPNMAYDNAALNAAIQRALPGWSWKSWYKTVGSDLYICYYLYQ